MKLDPSTRRLVFALAALVAAVFVPADRLEAVQLLAGLYLGQSGLVAAVGALKVKTAAS